MVSRPSIHDRLIFHNFCLTAAYLRNATRRDLASAVLLLRSSHKLLETAVQGGNASEMRVQLLASLSETLTTIQDKLAQLPSS